MVVFKALILNSFYIGRVWWSWKNWFLTVSTFGRYGGLERTDFEQFLFWEGVVVLKELILNSVAAMVVLKELIFNSFYIWHIWWCWKNWFLTVSTFDTYGGLKRTDFEHFLFWEGMVVLKELIFNSFYFGMVWWYWKNWFWTMWHLGCYGGVERTDF